MKIKKPTEIIKISADDKPMDFIERPKIKKAEPIFSFKKVYKETVTISPAITRTINLGHNYDWYLEKEKKRIKSKAEILMNK